MSSEEIVQLLAGLRPKGIEPASYKMVVDMIINAVMLEVTRKDDA